jgi:hypothetical protein
MNTQWMARWSSSGKTAAMMLRPIYDWELRGLLEKNLTD